MHIYHLCLCLKVEAEKTNKKGDKKKELEELNELFKPVVAAQKVSKGTEHTVCECDRRWMNHNSAHFSL